MADSQHILIRDLIHISSDVFSFFGYGFVAIIGLYIYRRGRLHSIEATHPDLWKLGIIFLILSSLARLSSSLQMSLQLVADVDTVLITISFKILLSIVCIIFGYRSWRAKEDLIQIAAVWREVINQTRKDRW